jgi:protein-tyrosine phosphatase
MSQSTPFTILCVCTGNVCRSPAAERLLAARLGPTVAVHSAGTHALVGDPIAPQMITLVTGTGALGEGFVARQLVADLVQGSDLVLGMTREHRARAVETWPGAVRRAFTLREFARLTSELDAAELPSGTPAERLRALVPLGSARRRMILRAAAVDDVTDPYLRDDSVYAESFGAIEEAVDQISSRIVGTGRYQEP